MTEPAPVDEEPAIAVGDVVWRKERWMPRREPGILLGEVTAVTEHRFEVRWMERNGFPITPWVGLSNLEQELHRVARSTQETDAS